MPPPSQVSEGARGRAEPSWLSPHEFRNAGAWLETRRQARGLGKRKVLTRLEYEGGTNRLNAVLDGKQRPTPAMLRRLCDAIEVPYLEAVIEFGYYREFVRILADLVRLSETWLEEYDARGTRNVLNKKAWSRLNSIEQTGILRFGEKLWRDCHNEPWFGERFFVASYDEHRAVMPKPIAVAIYLVTLAFPRRGDIWRAEAREYRQSLLGVANEWLALIGAVKPQPGRPKNQDPLLCAIEGALSNEGLQFENRILIAAEYAVTWADRLCNPGTHAARLGAFAFWGAGGAAEDNPDPFAIMPQFRRSVLPPLAALRPPARLSEGSLDVEPLAR